jgi:hypothetical protein
MKALIFFMLIFGVTSAHADFNIAPPWMVYCTPYMAANLPCSYQTYVDYLNGKIPAYKPQPKTLPVGTAPAYTPGPLGATANEMFSAFSANVLKAFETNKNINVQFSTMQSSMLATLSTLLPRSDPTHAYEGTILKLAAAKLSPSNLVRLREAFGPAVDVYVADFSPPSNAAQYAAVKPQFPLAWSGYYYSYNKISAPAIPGMVPGYTAVFLEMFLLGNDPPQMALHKALTYIQVQTKQIEGAAPILQVVGWVVGIGLPVLITYISAVDPDFIHDIIVSYLPPLKDTTVYSPGNDLTPTIMPMMPPNDSYQPPSDVPDPVYPPMEYGPDLPWTICDSTYSSCGISVW